MVVTLPAVSTGTPTIRTYNFTLELTSPLGGDTGYYTITVINQNTPTGQGGPGMGAPGQPNIPGQGGPGGQMPPPPPLPKK
jgi:hypothetical protein